MSLYVWFDCDLILSRLCRWDEWVPPQRLLEFNEVNIALQKSLIQSSKEIAAQSTNAKASATTKAQPVGRRKEGRGTKRGRDDDDGTRRPELRLVIPEVLKVLLVDDWEAVTKNNQVGACSTAVHLNV